MGRGEREDRGRKGGRGDGGRGEGGWGDGEQEEKARKRGYSLPSQGSVSMVQQAGMKHPLYTLLLNVKWEASCCRGRQGTYMWEVIQMVLQLTTKPSAYMATSVMRYLADNYDNTPSCHTPENGTATV